MTAMAISEVIITNEVGLHARPSVKFTKLAKTFPFDELIKSSRKLYKASSF